MMDNLRSYQNQIRQIIDNTCKGDTLVTGPVFPTPCFQLILLRMNRTRTIVAAVVSRGVNVRLAKSLIGDGATSGQLSRGGTQWYWNQRKFLSSSGGGKEGQLQNLLRSKVAASKAVVQDISGGCGSMYKIEVESPMFKGKGLVAQHRMVKEALRDEIASMHGLTILTRAPPS
ncbi:unnamed protein product [Choristocarpus tenellus]